MANRLSRLGALLGATFCASVIAAQPPLDEAARARAAEAAARNAWNAQVAAYQLCRAQDEVAARYHAEMTQAGKPVAPPVATAECTDPGPFVSPTPPLEAAGAHSPPEDAARPPSSPATEAELEGSAKD